MERLITTAKWAALVLTLGLAAATDVMQAVSIPATEFAGLSLCTEGLLMAFGSRSADPSF